MLDLVSRYADIISFYIPLGIIGIWRWSIWLLHSVTAHFYHMPRGDFKETLSIVTPVYNEDPNLFNRALKSWKKNGPDEIIAVIDYEDAANIEIFKKFQESCPEAKLIVTDKPGKRPALADGIREATGEIVALVDSDTVWQSKIKKHLIGPFSDPLLGGLVPRQDVMNAETAAQKIFKIHLASRYLIEFPFLATASDVLTCLSGRTAVYRKSAIEDKLDVLVNETFLGERMISGDDKTLTNLVQAAGWKTTFLRDVKVYTTGVPKISSLLKQELRWARNALRSDLKILSSDWLWKKQKVLLFHMLDKFIQPLTLLLAPIYLIISLIYGYWEAATIIILWWILSRSIKIYPYLKENPKDFTILPLYILMTFTTAIIRIYALVTVGRQGWITRWDKKRLTGNSGFFHFAPYFITSCIIAGLFFAVYNYKDNVLNKPETAQRSTKSIKSDAIIKNNSIFTPYFAEPQNEEIIISKDELMRTQMSDPFGYYVVKFGDTYSSIRSKFNLPADAKLLEAQSKDELLSNFAITTGKKLAIKTADLQTPFDKNVLIARSRSFPQPAVSYDQSTRTIYVRKGGSVATLQNIASALGVGQKELLEEVSPGTWILRANIYLTEDVILAIDGSYAKTVLLQSDDKRFVWIRSESGGISITGSILTSWDEKRLGPDEDVSNGRAYITAKNSGRMDISDSQLSYLGYEGYPKRGGLFGGSYGISWKIKNNAFRDNLITGVVQRNSFHHNYFGLYTFGATGMIFRNNEIHSNLEYGLDPHDDSNNFIVEYNNVHDNGNHGIIFSRRCFSNVIRYNISKNNKLHGIMLDRNSNNNLVLGNTSKNNTDGITLYDSHENIILSNNIESNSNGIRMNAGSSGNYMESNLISNNKLGIYLYGDSSSNIATKNTLKSNHEALVIKNSSFNTLIDNFRTSQNTRDGRVTPDSYGNIIR
jgi:hyaluronan synthase